jgi:hypothetical protein
MKRREFIVGLAGAAARPVSWSAVEINNNSRAHRSRSDEELGAKVRDVALECAAAAAVADPRALAW